MFAAVDPFLFTASFCIFGSFLSFRSAPALSVTRDACPYRGGGRGATALPARRRESFGVRTPCLVSYSPGVPWKKPEKEYKTAKECDPESGRILPTRRSFSENFPGLSGERRVCSYAKSFLTGRRPPISSLRRHDLLVLLLTIEVHKVTFPLNHLATCRIHRSRNHVLTVR